MSAATCTSCGAERELADGLCGECWDARADAAQTGALASRVESFARRFVVLPGEPEWTAFSLFVLHTYALEGAHATPYLLILSPEKRSGKTRVQEVLELLVAHPWRVTGASEAAIFRKIAQDRPTLLLDEIDAIFGTHSERTEPLRAILNAGNRPGATVARCVGEKGDQVRDFDVFCAKALAGIDKGERIPDTIRDRALTISMRRKTGAEPVERFRHRVADGEAEPLRAELAAWSDAVAERLLAAEPATPHELDDRAAEAWEPLFAIADLAGSDWPKRARAAAIALSAGGEQDDASLGALLLEAIRVAFAASDRMTSADLLAALNADEELPFGGWRDGKGLDSRKLAKLLRPYKVKPRTIRVGDDPNHRGYLREQFVDAWERWTPTRTEAPQAPQAPQVEESAVQGSLEQAVVADVADVADISTGVADEGARGANGAVSITSPDEEARAARLLGVALDDGEAA